MIKAEQLSRSFYETAKKTTPLIEQTAVKTGTIFNKVQHEIKMAGYNLVGEQFIGLTEIRLPHSILEETANLFTDDWTLFIASNHPSHYDVFPMVKIAKQLREGINHHIDSKHSQKRKINTIYFPLSPTLQHEQGSDLKASVSHVIPWLASQNAEPLFVLREKDAPEVKHKYRQAALDSVRKLVKAPDEHKLVTVCYPGTVEESRLDEYGLRKGMQKVEGGFGEIVYSWLKKGKRVAVIPVSLLGTDAINNPKEKKLSERGEKAIRHNLGHPLNPVRLAHAYVGSPRVLSLDRLNIEKNKAVNRLNDEIMRTIASNIDFPVTARGVYNNF